ncbi:MAG: hypothetical protein QW228_08225 [Candidatus Aenigmatarchaeota archaeon]
MREKSSSRTLLSIVFIILVLLAVVLFYLISKRILERLFLRGLG